MNHHVEVLQQRTQARAVRRRRREVGVERVVVHHHQEEEEHLHRGDDRHDPGNQQPMPFAVHVDGDAAENREQRDPEHQRPVETAPVRRQFVEQRLRAVGIALHVLDAEVADDEGVDDDGGEHAHDRGHGVEEAGAAVDERPLPAPGTRRSTPRTRRSQSRTPRESAANPSEAMLLVSSPIGRGGRRLSISQSASAAGRTSDRRSGPSGPPLRTSTGTSPSCRSP